MYRVCKEYHWEGAHRLYKYKGACAQIHGHSYRMQVTFIAYTLDNQGFVADFNDIDGIVKPIVDTLDHKIVLDKRDSGKGINKKEIVRLPNGGNPTVETMCHDIYHTIEEMLVNTTMDNVVILKKVRIWETAKCYAEYEK